MILLFNRRVNKYYAYFFKQRFHLTIEKLAKGLPDMQMTRQNITHNDNVWCGSSTYIPRVSIGIRGWGMIGAKIFSAMDQSNQEVEVCGKLHPSQARSQDFILGGGSEHAKRGP